VKKRENVKQILLNSIIFIYTFNFLLANNCIENINNKNNYSSAEDMYILGLMYKKGICVDKNMTKAFQYFQASNAKQYTFSKYELADMYYYGEGIKQDFKKAFNLYENILKTKILTGMIEVNLGYMYLNGEGIKKNITLAKEYYIKSSHKNNIYALYNLGLLNLSGLGGIKDIDKAIYYFQKAADKNYPDAQYKLAQTLIIKNKKLYMNKAIELLGKAVENGSNDAKLALDYLKTLKP
jgi:TPR repeat protein